MATTFALNCGNEDDPTSPVGGAGAGARAGAGGSAAQQTGGQTSGAAGDGGDSAQAGHGTGGAEGGAPPIPPAGAGGSGGDGASAGEGGAHPDCPYPLRAEPDSANIVLTHGHTDVLTFRLGCSDPALEIVASEDFPIAFGQKATRQVENVLVYGSPDAIVTLPDPADAPGYERLGEAGREIWILPEVQIETVVWPGFNAYDVPHGSAEGDTLELRLVEMEGPGSFHAFSTGGDGSPMFLLDPAQGTNAMEVATGSHVHMNWAFGSAGVYALSFEARLRTPDGQVLTSETQRLRFFFGDLADLPSTEPTVLRIDGLLPAYAASDTVSLQAAKFGAQSSLEVRWWRQCFDLTALELGPWTHLADGTESSLPASSFRPPEGQSCQFRASLWNGTSDYSVSQPVVPLIQ